MYRDDGEAARQRTQALEEELRTAQEASPEAVAERLRALEEELAGLRAGLEVRARHVGEMQGRLAELRQTGAARLDEPPPRAPTRTWLGIAITAVLVVALFGIFVVSLAVAGDALTIFRRGTSASRPAAAPPPLTERDILGFPSRVDVDAVLYGILGDHPGARVQDVIVAGVDAGGFVDLNRGGLIVRMLDTRGRAVEVRLEAGGLARTDWPNPDWSPPAAPICTTRALWERAVANGAPDGALAAIRYDAEMPEAPWLLVPGSHRSDLSHWLFALELAEEVWRFSSDCTPVIAPVLGDFPLPRGKRPDDPPPGARPSRTSRDPLEALLE